MSGKTTEEDSSSSPLQHDDTEDSSMMEDNTDLNLSLTEEKQEEEKDVDATKEKPFLGPLKRAPQKKRESPISRRRQHLAKQRSDVVFRSRQAKMLDYFTKKEDEKEFSCYCGIEEGISRHNIQCDICKKWLHMKCANSHREPRKNRRVFVCLNCKISPPNVFEESPSKKETRSVSFCDSPRLLLFNQKKSASSIFEEFGQKQILEQPIEQPKNKEQKKEKQKKTPG